MRIGIDLDGVVYDFVDALRAYLLSTKHQPPLTRPLLVSKLSESTRWEFYKDWGLTTEEFIAVCDAGVDAGVIFVHGAPYPGAVEALNDLRDAGHTLHIITDRHFGSSAGMNARAHTVAWLHRYHVPYDSLTFSSDKTAVDTHMMIEDKIENYDALIESDVDAYLLNRPWNQSANDGRDRVNSLAEFVERVRGMDDLLFGEPPAVAEPANIDGDERTGAIAGVTGEVRTVSSTGGEKGVKPQRYDLIPADPLRQLAEHYGKGAEKYADNQWRKGYEWSKSFQAMQRHAWQWFGGETFDEETGSNHMTAVAWHAFALLQFAADHPEHDDRPTS